MSPLFDPEELRLSEAEKPPRYNQNSVRKRKKWQGGWFVKGPLPLSWLTKAARLQGKVLHVGIALWFLVGLKRSRRVRLPQSTLKIFGVSRQASYRALRRLEKNGLVLVERHPGRLPIVTLLEVTTTREEGEK